MVVKKNATPGVYKVVLTINEGSAVKVAEKTFEVKDFNFDINPKVVQKKGTDVVITCSQWNNDITNKAYTTELTGVTINQNEITVPNATTEGTYTITYTTWKDDAAKVSYTNTFKVFDTHEVTLSKNKIDRNQGTGIAGETTTDAITVTTTINGAATTDDLTSKLSVVKSDKTTPANDGDFTFTQDGTDTNTYTLKCKNTVAPGNYYVMFMNTVAGADTPEFASFVVVE